MIHSKPNQWLMVCTALALTFGLSGGCPQALTLETSPSDAIGNPFATLSDQGLVEVNIETESSELTTGAAAGADADISFRSDMSVSFVNTATDRELSTNFIAWVEPGNVRTEAQRDALISSGYIVSSSDRSIGSAYTLTAGTFVYEGSGGGGLERVTLGPTGSGATVIPDTLTITLVTPDIILVYLDPPSSCSSTAFRFLDEGDIIAEPQGGGGGGQGSIIFGSATNIGPNKTLGQIDAYQCDPFRPGLFLRQGGGMRLANEFVEGDALTFTFLRFPVDETNNFDPDGNAALVTFGGQRSTITQTSTDGTATQDDEDNTDGGDGTDDGGDGTDTSAN